MNQLQLNVPLDKVNSWLISHFRYALPRHSYIVRECANDIQTHWLLLSSNTRDLIERELNEHLRRYQGYQATNHQCDYRTWQDLAIWIRRHRYHSTLTQAELPQPLPIVSKGIKYKEDKRK